MNTNDYTAWRFDALDTWFFREARPFDTLGAPELDSVFPPPAPTVAGVVKTLIGRRAGIDWREFAPKAAADEPRHPRFGLLGDLRLQGPFPCRDGEPLFPAPLFLLKHKEHGFRRLAIGAAVETDLGVVRLPSLPKTGDANRDKGYKPLENAWLTAAGLRAALDGKELDSAMVCGADELFAPESRLGIARDNKAGTVKEGLLYQTRHIRPRDNVGLIAGVGGLQPDFPGDPGPARLGGEGRLALINIGGASPLAALAAPKPDIDTHGLILVLLTPADLDSCWRLPKSEAVCPADRNGGAKFWECELHGVQLRVHSAVLGKPRREGGWQLAERKPRRVEGFVPAGSAWYCTVAGGTALAEAIGKLHLRQIGDGQQLGRGLLAVGLWPRGENLESLD